MPAKLKRAKQLADAVAATFYTAGFSSADLLKGPIALTDLSWQIPPLRVDAMLRGLPLSDYLDYPVSVVSEKLYEFYKNTLYGLAYAPEEVVDGDGYKKTYQVISASRGERDAAFSMPDRWPEIGNDTAVMFALECAHVFKTSGSCKGFVSDKDNYFAQTEWGAVGVREGMVTEFADFWDQSVAGYVGSLTEQPRGLPSTDCHYDVLARLRSVLFENSSKFNEFEALDMAIQALRVWSAGETPKDLLKAIDKMPADALVRRTTISAYRHAVEVMEAWQINDRTKLSMLIDILVPSQMSLYQFSKTIYDAGNHLPALLPIATEKRIINRLRTKLEFLERLESAKQSD